jgi:hypothetical protein
VIVKDMAVEVETKTVVRLWARRVDEDMERNLGSQAVAMPSREPVASTVAKSERPVGRKERALRSSREASLVSWMHTTTGEARERAFRTEVHLSSSPRPRVFQETIGNFLKLFLSIKQTRHRWETNKDENGGMANSATPIH